MLINIFTLPLDSKGLKILTPFIIFPTYILLLCVYACVYLSVIINVLHNIHSFFLKRYRILSSSVLKLLPQVFLAFTDCVEKSITVPLQVIMCFTMCLGGFLFTYPTSHLLSILDLWFGFFHNLWKIFSHYLFEYCFCTILSPQNQLYMCQSSLLPVSCLPFVFSTFPSPCFTLVFLLLICYCGGLH